MSSKTVRNCWIRAQFQSDFQIETIHSMNQQPERIQFTFNAEENQISLAFPNFWNWTFLLLWT